MGYMLRLINPLMFRFYVWGQIEPNSVDKHTIIEVFGHFGHLLRIVSQSTSFLSKNMKM